MPRSRITILAVTRLLYLYFGGAKYIIYGYMDTYGAGYRRRQSNQVQNEENSITYKVINSAEN